MADVISRIVLQAQGGDQVAREVGKITKAYKEAEGAASGLSGGGGGSSGGGVNFDAFHKATAPGMDHSSRRNSNYDYESRVRQRRVEHESLVSQNRGSSNLRGQMTGAVNTATQFGGGDVSGGAASGLSNLASLGGKAGVAGAVIAAVSAAVVGTWKLAEKDSEKQAQFSHGLMQSLNFGDNYDSMKAQFIHGLRGSKTSVMSEQMMLSIMQSAKATGASMNMDTGFLLSDIALTRGLDVSAGMRYSGTRQKMGLGAINRNSNSIDLDLTRGENAFGRPSLDTFIGALSTALEGAMARGMKTGSISGDSAYTNFTRFLSALGSAGGMTLEGATQTFNQVQSSVSSAQSLSRPQDVFQFMSQRRAGESYGDTVRRISAPGAEIATYRDLKAQAGGNRANLEILVQQQFGVDWQAVPGLIDTFENQLTYIDNPGKAYVGKGFTPDSYLVESIKRGQMNIGEGLQTGLGRFWNWGTRFLRRGMKELSPEERAIVETLQGGYRGKTLSGSLSQADPRSMGMLDPSLAGFQSAAIQGQDASGQMGMVMSELIPQLAAYQAFKQDPSRISSKKERAMFEQNSPVFDEVIRMLAIPGMAATLTSNAGAVAFSGTLKDVNATTNMDYDTKIISIVEILEALIRMFGTENTDDGSTDIGG